MKNLALIVFMLVLGQQFSFATLQEPDYLIWNNDTLYLNKSPLEQLPDICKKIREKERITNSGCWNGFIGEWTIIDSVLYLKNLYSFSTGENINKRLEEIIGVKFEKGLLRADWYTDNIYGGFGRKLYYIYLIIYEKERALDFQNGVIQTISVFDAKNHKYSIDEKVLKNYVYQNFNWKIFDSIENFREIVAVAIGADNYGNLETSQIMISAGSEVDKEVERVLKSIPNWGTYYKNGEVLSFSDSYRFEFSDELRNKYDSFKNLNDQPYPNKNK